MNPILAAILVFFIVHVGMMIAHFILVVIVSHDIIATTGKIWMSYDELDKEMDRRVLGRFALNTYPVAFWWLLAWERIMGDDDD